jgi:hypothetical protein
VKLTTLLHLVPRSRMVCLLPHTSSSFGASLIEQRDNFILPYYSNRLERLKRNTIFETGSLIHGPKFQPALNKLWKRTPTRISMHLPSSKTYSPEIHLNATAEPNHCLYSNLPAFQDVSSPKLCKHFSSEIHVEIILILISVP